MKRFSYTSTTDVNDAKRGLEKCSRRYNHVRLHSSLDDKTPDEFYFDNLPLLPKAVWALTARLPLKKWETLTNQAAPPLTPFCISHARS
jgi:hypothetical protein